MLSDAFARLQGFARVKSLRPRRAWRKDLFLDLGGDERLSLHPFIVPVTCPDCETEEIFFVDAWDRRRNAARMKSFEKGHTITDSGISDSLSGWGNPE